MDVAFIAFKVNKGTQDDGNGLRILADLEEIHFDVFCEVVFVEISGQLVILLMSITQKDDGFGIGQFEFEEDVLHLDRIVTLSLSSDHVFNGSELTAFGCSLDVFMVNFLVSGRVDNCSQEEEDAIE